MLHADQHVAVAIGIELGPDKGRDLVESGPVSENRALAVWGSPDFENPRSTGRFCAVRERDCDSLNPR
jgi:hypothetical protein